MLKHMEVKRLLKSIASLHEFNGILDSTTLSDEDKHIMRQHYIQNKNLAYIADELGYSESCIKQRHHKILCLLANIMDE